MSTNEIYKRTAEQIEADLEFICQVGRGVRFPFWDGWTDPCPQPPFERILTYNENSGVNTFMWFCQDHFGFLRTVMQIDVGIISPKE